MTKEEYDAEEFQHSWANENVISRSFHDTLLFEIMKQAIK
jgi:hypothetical protein